ncbi:hypothetical protein PV08_01925 [Exophiala spinifera]|uniref:Acyltransferase 3 domain-containing protein n=1 Tax=Exophiala spinifera TaxID=91928 RepID=A0A0D2BSD5_9EURO|nr:uncharacterized protein PV08_01925 [Exophiala spinifera]KIW21345.1 hypothetical protein PV08_01925 [Exophiala spinifera]
MSTAEDTHDQHPHVSMAKLPLWYSSGYSQSMVRANHAFTGILSLMTWLLPECLHPRGSANNMALRPTAYLDAIRGYAAWSVVNHHLRNHTETWLFQQPPLLMLHKGSLAVDIFFIISGFVLSRRALDLVRQEREVALLECLASSTFRRYIRLYLSAAVGTFIAMVLFYFNIWSWYSLPRCESFGAQLLHWVGDVVAFSDPFADLKGWYYTDVFTSKYLFVLWTIPIEFRGSMVVFLFCTATCKFSARARTVACWLCILLCYIWQRVYISLFLFGVLLAEISLSRQSTSKDDLPVCEQKFSPIARSKRAAFHLVPITILIIGIFLSNQPVDLGLHGPNPWPYLDNCIPSWWEAGAESTIHFWTSIGACCILYAIETYPAFRRPLETSFSQYLGRLSFGMYIMHVIVQMGLYERVLNPAREVFLGESLLSYCVIYVPFMIVVLWVADYFNRMDRLVINFSRWLEKRLFAQDSGQSSK